MSYLIFLLCVCALAGLVGVASNPSPYYGAIGLLLGAAACCGVLVGVGASFVGLVLLLIYLGGMLVVFAYSVALAAEPFPETWGGVSVVVYVVGFGAALLVFGGLIVDLVSDMGAVDGFGLFTLREDFCGVAVMFYNGGPVLVLCGWGLLLALLVVLELVRGRLRGGLRVP